MKIPHPIIRLRNNRRLRKSLRHGYDSYIDVEGHVRFNKSLEAGRPVKIPAEHYALIQGQGFYES